MELPYDPATLFYKYVSRENDIKFVIAFKKIVLWFLLYTDSDSMSEKESFSFAQFTELTLKPIV